MLGAPEALIEFNEYIILADSKFDLNRFKQVWAPISAGTYTTKQIRYSNPFNTWYVATATTQHPFMLSDYPIDSEGYPTQPRETNNYFFQRGAGWFERTEEHKSDLIVDTVASNTTGCTPTLQMKFRDFTWGGFWTMGKYSNEFNAPYLDRFWRFPLTPFGFGLRRIIDDKKSWIRIDDTQQLIPDYYVYFINPSEAQEFKSEIIGYNCTQLENQIKKLEDELPSVAPISLAAKQILSQIQYIKFVKDKKCKQTLSEREYAFKNRAAYYQSVDERLVLNVKNIDLSLNIGQGLAYDVWQQSANSNCFFSGGSLPSPYPNKNGKWDATNPKLDAKKT